MSYETLKYEAAAGIAVITLARPERLNALTATMHAELRAALAACARDDAVRVVMLTGEGRAFSSGQDLTEDLPRSADGAIDLGPPLARDYNPLIMTLADYPKVTIAALNGPAVGAAANIALACDVAIAARSAFLQQAFTKVALIPDAGGTWLLPRLVGPKRALALMLTADPTPAEEALRLGLVYAVFDDVVFPAEAMAFVARIAQGPALAQRLMKKAVRESLGASLDEQLDREAAFQAECGRSDDFAEGVAAFREKRAPRFAGN
ncbi:MAG: 2-(1,2-epoxy-1,2-dihydrophenyl)acetyl-CoA isomerase [Salinarimonadaceae bacterium]|nr:MAG: 2-(1,2-epoxy-1,2-dihydrophenyl)acetyl-CoA isomerase [Salinarimonadaceae bacterium]